MNLDDQYCLDLFPELLDIASKEELDNASRLGSYIFHEDYFLRLIVGSSDKSLFERAAHYIEYLCANENHHLKNLGVVALLEGLISSNLVEIRPYLGRESCRSISKIIHNFDVDEKGWKPS